MTLAPGPRPRLSLSLLLPLSRNPLRFLQDAKQRWGDLVGMQIGPQKLFLVFHPDDIGELLVKQSKKCMKGQALQRAKQLLGEGLLTSEGAYHDRQRRLIVPLFHRQRIDSYAPVMVECAARTAEIWKDGQTVDVAQEMAHLTLKAVSRCLFGANVDDQAADITRSLTSIFELFAITPFPLMGVMEKLRRPRLARARALLDATIYALIAERRANPAAADDLLSRLLAAEDAGGGRMTDEQVRDEAMTLFLAGHETTANALAWTWYLLHQHAQVAERMRAELDQVLGGRLPSADDFDKLVYTKRVLAESVRLYPPVWAIGRRMLEDVTLGEYVLPTGSLAVTSQYITHRDPRWFPEPERFDPDRWSAEPPRYAYFPFGGGPRTCIGEGFAWMEGVLVLATIAQRWQLQLVAGHPIDLHPGITLRPRHGMRMVARRR